MSTCTLFIIIIIIFHDLHLNYLVHAFTWIWPHSFRLKQFAKPRHPKQFHQTIKGLDILWRKTNHGWWKYDSTFQHNSNKGDKCYKQTIAQAADVLLLLLLILQQVFLYTDMLITSNAHWKQSTVFLFLWVGVFCQASKSSLVSVMLNHYQLTRV